MALNFIHLSDIHFSSRPHDWDRDADLRNEIELDLTGLVDQFGPADYVIVTGDVAFSGKPDQYPTIERWLRRIASRFTGGGPDRILVVPGNHDVDRDVAGNRRMLQLAQREIRQTPDDKLDGRMAEILNDPEMGPALMSPLEAYNGFAAQYGCAITAAKPWWHRELELGSGYVLQVRGATSVLVSDGSDDENANRLVVPTQMITFPRRDGGVPMLLMHHPPFWLRNREQLRRILNNRFRLQFFGHRHQFETHSEDHTVVIDAGAAHPERTHDWHPHYNVVSVAVFDGQTLRVTVRPRRWHPNEHRFGADSDSGGRPFRTRLIPLAPLPQLPGARSGGRQPNVTPTTFPDGSASTSRNGGRFTVAARAKTTGAPPPRTGQVRVFDNVPRHQDRRVTVRMPFNDTCREATVVLWSKRVGDHVETDDPLCEIDTEKTAYELVSPASGTLVEILVGDGQRVPADTALATIELDRRN